MRGQPRAFWTWPLAWPSPSGPLGRQRSSGALDAGGADPDNARRSGPGDCDILPATGAPNGCTLATRLHYC